LLRPSIGDIAYLCIVVSLVDLAALWVKSVVRHGRIGYSKDENF